jgi:hypothetical protein
MHLPQIHTEVLYIAIQYIKQNELTIDKQLLRNIFKIYEIQEFLDCVDLNQNDHYVVIEYVSFMSNKCIEYQGKMYHFSDPVSLASFVSIRGMRYILTKYFKYYYTQYIDELIHKYNNPKQTILLNHYLINCCCISFFRLYNEEEYIHY